MKRVISRIVQYPYVVVTIRCRFCSRHVRHYRLARLAHRLGPDADVETILDVVACPYGRPKGIRKPRSFCGVYFADLDVEILDALAEGRCGFRYVARD